MTTPEPREPGAARAGGYPLALTSVLVVIAKRIQSREMEYETAELGTR